MGNWRCAKQCIFYTYIGSIKLLNFSSMMLRFILTRPGGLDARFRMLSSSWISSSFLAWWVKRVPERMLAPHPAGQTAAHHDPADGVTNHSQGETWMAAPTASTRSPTRAGPIRRPTPTASPPSARSSGCRPRICQSYSALEALASEHDQAVGSPNRRHRYSRDCS